MKATVFQVGDTVSHFTEAGHVGVVVRVGRPWWAFFGRVYWVDWGRDACPVAHTHGLWHASATNRSAADDAEGGTEGTEGVA